MLKVENFHPLAAVLAKAEAAAAAATGVKSDDDNYALWEELEGQDMERTSQVYTACLELLPL